MIHNSIIPGDGGLVLTPKPIWMQTSIPGDYWDNIVYGNGMFVVNNHTNPQKLLYSYDGITWNKNETAFPYVSNRWHTLAYGGGIFVTIYNNTNAAAYSTDGINWTQTTLPVSGKWKSVCYGAGKFVALAEDANTGAYSTDGINWIQMTLPRNVTDNHTLCYGKGIFVSFPDANYVMYSNDGINWASTATSFGVMYDAAYGSGMFIAVGSNRVKTSIDGISWTIDYDHSFINVTYAAERFLVLRGTELEYSFDGVNWKANTLPSGAYGRKNAMAFGKGKLVLIPQQISGMCYDVLYLEPTYKELA